VKIDNINEIIRSYRHDLPPNSKTAQAIDRGTSLEEISECAAEEGIHQLAAVLFEVQQEDLKENTETDYNVVTIEAIRKFRRSIPETSQTAKAIDRGAPWEEVSKFAEEESLRQSQLAAILFEAQQQRLRTKNNQ
jgi:choline kinase